MPVELFNLILRKNGEENRRGEKVDDKRFRSLLCELTQPLAALLGNFFSLEISGKGKQGQEQKEYEKSGMRRELKTS